jgi:hypothetical protein
MVQGTRRYWSLSGAPRHDDLGNFLGFRGVASDVTEQRKPVRRSPIWRVMIR